MFHLKMIEYRKKNMMTQEELADRLGVSRQTITKWEKGTILPSLEYLIDLSRLFGVTIDHLIKDDDCICESSHQVHTTALAEFLVTAKRSTYAARKNKTEGTRQGSHDYMFSRNPYTYRDSFFGASCFSGQELVYRDAQACWSMNYYGTVLHEAFHGDFLKEALMLVDTQRPYRGPAMYRKGEYTYISEVEGDICLFQGHESIFYQTQKIYEGCFHGGVIQ